jgi:hypothetical protein
MDGATSHTRRGLPGTSLSLALLGAVVLAPILLVMLLSAPASGARFAVGNAVGTDCPSGVGAPVCFTVTVTNTGNEQAGIVCEASTMAGNTASFVGTDANQIYAEAVRPADAIELTLAATTTSDAVYTPIVTCDTT